MQGGVNASSRYKVHGGEIVRPGLGVGEKEKGDRPVGTVALYRLGRVTEATWACLLWRPGAVGALSLIFGLPCL